MTGYPHLPPGPPPGGMFTPWIRRVLACVLDVLPIWAGFALWNAVAIVSGDMGCVTQDNGGVVCTATHSPQDRWVLASVVVLSSAYAVWNYGYRQGTTGSSIGKSVMKFRVVSEKSWQPIGFGLSLVRQLAHVVDAVICFIGYLFPLWDAKRQTLADKIMKTVCVPRKPRGQRNARK